MVASTATLSLTDVQTFTALRTFITAILPTQDVNGKTILEVVRGQDNRVPEPAVDNFITMTYISKQRLSTNVVAYGQGDSSVTREDLVPTRYCIRLGVFGSKSADNAQVISSLLRSDYATDIFKSSGFDVAPLYHDDPRQIPFINGEQQVEQRWNIDIYLQCNPVVSITGLESATEIEIGATNLVVPSYGFVTVDNNFS